MSEELGVEFLQKIKLQLAKYISFYESLLNDGKNYYACNLNIYPF